MEFIIIVFIAIIVVVSMIRVAVQPSARVAFDPELAQIQMNAIRNHANRVAARN